MRIGVAFPGDRGSIRAETPVSATRTEPRSSNKDSADAEEGAEISIYGYWLSFADRSGGGRPGL